MHRLTLAEVELTGLEAARSSGQTSHGLDQAFLEAEIEVLRSEVVWLRSLTRSAGLIETDRSGLSGF